MSQQAAENNVAELVHWFGKDLLHKTATESTGFATSVAGLGGAGKDAASHEKKFLKHKKNYGRNTMQPKGDYIGSARDFMQSFNYSYMEGSAHTYDPVLIERDRVLFDKLSATDREHMALFLHRCCWFGLASRRSHRWY